jgi:chromosome segregation protein
MGTAIARVEQRITIDGVNNASDAINQARASLGGLEKAAQSADRATKQIDAGKKLQEVRELSGDADTALKSLADFAGPAAGKVSELGDAFGAVEAVMRLIPGTAGLAVTAVSGLAIAGKLLSDHISQSEAKLRLLGGGAARQLGSDLRLSADEAVALSQAIDRLPATLRPTSEMLAVVRRQAESIGADGAAAMTAFAKAIGSGGEQLAEFERTYGRVRGLVTADDALVRSLGLSAETLGVAKATTDEQLRQQEIGRAVSNLRQRLLEQTLAEKEAAHLRGVAEENQGRFAGQLAASKLGAAERAVASARNQVEAEREVLAQLQRQTEAATAAAEARAGLAARAELLEAQAAASASRTESRSLRSTAASVRQLSAVRDLNAFDREHGRVLEGKLKTERDLLQVKVLQSDAAAKSLRQEAEQERAAAGRKAAERLQAERDAILRLDRARVAAATNESESYRRKLELVAAEQAAGIAAAARLTTTARGRAAVEQAIALESAAKRRELERAVVAERIKLEEDLRQTLVTAADRSVQIAQRAEDAVADAAAASAQRRIADLRAAGRDEQAVEAEVAAARAETARRLREIDRELVASRKTVAIGSVDAANLEAAADARRVAAREQLAAREAEITRARGGDNGAAIQRAAGLVTDAAAASSGRLAAGVGEAARSISSLSGSWEGLSKSAPDAISAVGGVAAAVVSGEKAQARILAITQFAAAAAAGATGNLVEAAGHLVAGGLYASAAGASPSAPTSGLTPSAPASGGGFAGGVVGRGGNGGGSGGSVTYVTNFNGAILMTRQQLGRGLKQTAAATRGTGF